MLRGILSKLGSKIKFALPVIIVALAVASSGSTASAQWGGYGGYGYGGYGSYHAPSVHYHSQFHGSSHWAPFRGYHSHGHLHNVPHYTPGHFHY